MFYQPAGTFHALQTAQIFTKQRIRSSSFSGTPL